MIDEKFLIFDKRVVFIYIFIVYKLRKVKIFYDIFLKIN